MSIDFKLIYRKEIDMNKILESAKQIKDEIITIRRTIHEHPEVGDKLPHTKKYVMDKLKEVDDVAYVRFASVYRQFKDLNTFVDELQKILSKGNN